jgi:hypothetical protein
LPPLDKATGEEIMNPTQVGNLFSGSLGNVVNSIIYTILLFLNNNLVYIVVLSSSIFFVWGLIWYIRTEAGLKTSVPRYRRGWSGDPHYFGSNWKSWRRHRQKTGRDVSGL